MDLFGLKKKRYWNEIFSNCDFEFAKDLLTQTFSGGVFPNDLVRLLNSYVNNPCRETAIELIEFDQEEFQKFYVDNKTMLESMADRITGRVVNKLEGTGTGASAEGLTTLIREEISKTLGNNVVLLHQEPEFQAYCEAFLEEDPIAIQKEKEAALIKKGYSEDNDIQGICRTYAGAGKRLTTGAHQKWHGHDRVRRAVTCSRIAPTTVPLSCRDA